MFLRKNAFPILLFILCWSAQTAAAWQRQPRWMLTTENDVWLTTPAGLVRYDPDGELFIPENFPRLPDFRPREIAADGDQLWLIGDSTAAYLDLNTGGRYAFSAADGLPPGRLTCIALDDDYIWVGTDRGVARFDRLIEQWESLRLPEIFPDSGSNPIHQIISTGDDYVYFAAEKGVLRFDRRTETFTVFSTEDGLKGIPYRDLLRFGDELWFFGENGIDIYSLARSNWSFLGKPDGLRSTEWRDIALIGGELYLLSDRGVDILDPSDRRLRSFERDSELLAYTVNDFFGSSTELWFATDQGILRYQVDVPEIGQLENWTLFDRSRGAVDSCYQRIGSAAGVIFGRGTQAVDVLDPAGGYFLTPLIYPEVSRGETERRGGLKFAWDENGLRLHTPSSELGVDGNYNYLVQSSEGSLEKRFWGRVQPYFTHRSGRAVNGIYDSTDPDQLIYGSTYRGAGNDLLQRIETGNRIAYRSTFDPFFGETTLRGLTAALETGPRSERKQRRLLRGELTAGQLITRSQREFFNGAQGPVYTLKHRDLLIGSARVSLNGRPLAETEFALNYTLGNFWLIFPGWELLNEGDVIEVEYQYRLAEEDIGETLTAAEAVLSGGDHFRVAVSGFEKGDNLSAGDSAEVGGFRGAQVSAEARGQVLGGEGELVLSAGANSPTGEFEISAESASIEAGFHRGAWTFDGGWLAFSDSMQTLEDRSTEFGALLGEDRIGLRFEPGGWLQLEGETSARRSTGGDERRYHLGGQFSPLSGSSLFGSLDIFDADADQFRRDRRIASLGFETAFNPAVLRALRLRGSRLFLITRFSEVRLDSMLDADSSVVDLRTVSFLGRWSLIPNAKISLYPELRWSATRRAFDGGSYRPYREEFAPRGSLYSRSLIPGLTTYIDAEAAYRQSDYADSASTRNLSFEREWVARFDITPGVYLSTLNPVSLRINLARNAEDSLLAIPDETTFFDLGTHWSDYAANVASTRFDTDALQVSWALHPHWLLYQSASEVRSSQAAKQQFFTTRLEWKPRSSDQVYWKYTLQRTLYPTGDAFYHRPGVEWYRRWSSRTTTRTQLYAVLINQSDQKSVSISPGGYLDHRFDFPWNWGQGIYRMDLSLTYAEQTLPDRERAVSIGGYCRLDWDFKRIFRLRLRWDEDYQYSLTEGFSDAVWKLEMRLTARF